LRLLRKKRPSTWAAKSFGFGGFFSPALRFKRLVFAHTHLLHKESLPTDSAGHFPPPSYSLEPRALFTCAHGIAIALFSTVPGQSRTKVVLYAEPLRHSTRKRVSDSCCRSQSPHPWSHNTQNHAFLGTIKKWGDSFWLVNTSEKVAAQVDNPSLASHFVNQRVKVIGTIDLSRNRIAVEAIAACA
jgi:hypothetical protein